MPRRLVRYHESKHSHFITFSCYERRPLLRDYKLYDVFLASLERTRVSFDLRLYAYVLMPEHVHLLMSEPDPERGTLADALHSLKLSVSKKRPQVSFANLGHQTPKNPLWYTRYYDRNIRNHDEFVEKLRYIHRNPVKRGLVERSEEWRWSSFVHYATGAETVVEIESEWTARRRELMGNCPTLKFIAPQTF
jgi:putative transposase